MNNKVFIVIGLLALTLFLFLINDTSEDDCEYDSSTPETSIQVDSDKEEDREEVVHEEIPLELPDAEIANDEIPSITPADGIEVPIGGACHNVYASHVGYSLSYDTINNCPFWVAWELTSEEAQGRHPRIDEFRADPQLPYKHQVSETAYRGSGYDRGHMCPAGDQKWSKEAMSESFFMSNMCPQAPVLNQQWWERLENAERRWAIQEGSVYIVCGPIFDSPSGANVIKGAPNVGIPDRFFKVILSLKPGKEKAIGFVFKNDNSRQPVGKAVLTVDQVEEMTGYDFFSKIEDEIETRIESTCNLGKWN